MKSSIYIKLFFALAVLVNLFSVEIYSQRIKWLESFEDAPEFYNNWKIVNNDSGAAETELYTGFDFYRLGPQSAQDGNTFVKLSFESINRYDRIDDWLISPKLFDIHSGDTLSFWCGAIDRTFKDSLKIYISTTGNNTTDFILIDQFKVDGPLGSWHKKSYDLSAYKGKNIYFAVNYYMVLAGAFGASSDNVWIDNFKLTGKGFAALVPGSFNLYQNFPNPFNPSTDIQFALPVDARVKLEIYNTLGQRVMKPVDTEYKSGVYSITINAGDLASGVYFYRLTAGDFIDEKKMVLIK